MNSLLENYYTALEHEFFTLAFCLLGDENFGKKKVIIWGHSRSEGIFYWNTLLQQY